MKRLFCWIAFFSLVTTVFLKAADAPRRTLKICVAPDAAPQIRHAAGRVLSAVPSHSLLRAMASGGAPRSVSDTTQLVSGPVADRAYSHLVIMGLVDDPLIKAAWQREARLLPDGGWYAFGYGNLSGDLGWVESDRNPFLHGAAIAKTPFETHVIILSGTTPDGVALAVDAFLDGGLVNGLVAAPGWKRGERTLLDRDPLPLPVAAPLKVPAAAGGFSLVGWTQPNEEEYRGVEDDAGIAPRTIARFKYFKPGEWDYAGSKFARTAYQAGLHRRSYGNTLWAAQFSDEGEAVRSAGLIAAAAKLQAKPGGVWTGTAAPHSDDKDEPAGPLTLWAGGHWIFMSTLPPAATDALRGSLEHTP